MSNMQENGLNDKILEEGLLFSFKFVYNDFNTVFDEEAEDNYMKLDEIKIAVGPYLLGILLAIFSLIIEMWVKNNL